jgi:exopolysaccharide biosynthesis protein
MASGAGSIAAVNAGFFNIKDGGSQTYIKISGRIIDSDTASKWPRVENMSGSVIIDPAGRISVMKAMRNGWYDSCSACRDALITGPLLLYHGKRARLPETSIVLNRHPRTCIGITKKGTVILLTLDGRTDQSVGMTLVKLTDLMISLKCTDAVNLDGGGSTTMWIRGKPFNGVVNMPCDNKKFDHDGERGVADILLIK